MWRRKDVVHGDGRIPAADLIRRLGRRIVKLRGSRRWSRQKLAQRLGIPRSRLGHWERGKCPPPLPDLLALGRCLEVSIEEMVLGDDTTPTHE